MNRCILATVALASSLALASPSVSACGEGQFNMGQGLRYQGYLAPHPATVLVYDDGATDRKALYVGLQKAGHKVTVVGSADAMTQALRAGHYDVVIADFDDAAALQSRAAGTSNKPGVLPVVALPKLTLGRSSAIDSTDWMSTSTVALCDALPSGGGSVPHVTAALVVFRGAAAAEVKSAPLASVSTQPSDARVAAVVLSIAGATAPSKSVAPP